MICMNDRILLASLIALTAWRNSLVEALLGRISESRVDSHVDSGIS